MIKTQAHILILQKDDFEDRLQTNIHDYVVSDLKPDAMIAYQESRLVLFTHGWTKVFKSNL